MTEHHYEIKTFDRYLTSIGNYSQIARSEVRTDVLEEALASCQAELRSVRQDRRLGDIPGLKKLIEGRLVAAELALEQKVRPLTPQTSEQ